MPRMTAVPLGVDVHETHTGIVVLIGELAYKVKKPLRTDFLDFSGLEARERVCAHEVQLNKRLAPDSYLGVGHFVGPQGGPAEPVIVMRRYPADRSLAALVSGGVAVEDQLSAIAQLLADFHARASRSPEVDVEGGPLAVAQRWTENLDELDRYEGLTPSSWQLDDIRRLASQYLAGRTKLFSDRVERGRVVDGHGDLMAADVFCVPDGPVVLDCLEFDDRLRYVDGIDDAAFLAMDLEFLDHDELARRFLADYRRAAADDAPESLAHFYIAYRAVVRAKVECIRAGQGVGSAIDDARRHVLLALQHLRAATVQLVLVGGGPGSGKSTLARELGPAIDAVVISTDDVRQDLLAGGEIDGGAGTFSAGRYSAQQVDSVYDAVLARAEVLLAGGRSVILDGTWRDERQRRRARDVAERHCCPTVELVCAIDVEQALERIRRRGTESSSEVTPEIAEQMYRSAPEWTNAKEIDTTQPLGESVAEATAICCLAV